MKKLAFIDLGFHQNKTKSSDFFIEFLKKYFVVDIFLDYENAPLDKSNKKCFLWYLLDYLFILGLAKGWIGPKVIL